MTTQQLAIVAVLLMLGIAPFVAARMMAKKSPVKTRRSKGVLTQEGSGASDSGLSDGGCGGGDGGD